MKIIYHLFLCTILLTSFVDKIDTANPYSDIEIVFGKSNVSVMACDRQYESYNGFSYSSAWLVKTADSFFIASKFRSSNIKFSSDSLFNYHFLMYNKENINSDSLHTHIAFRFSSEPAWFDLDQTENRASVSWLSSGIDTLFTLTDTFITDSTPAVYSLILYDGEVVGISSWNFQNRYDGVISIKPLEWNRRGNSLTRSAVISTRDSLGDTSHYFHFSSFEFYDDIDIKLNSPTEVIASSKRSLLIQPEDSLTLHYGDTETLLLTPNDSLTSIYFVFIDYSDKLNYTKVIAPLGTLPNASITNFSFGYFPSGDSSDVNGTIARHNINDLIRVHGNKVSIIRPEYPLSTTVNFLSSGLYYQGHFINDTVNNFRFIEEPNVDIAISFKQEKIQEARLMNDYGYPNSEFSYSKCEVVSDSRINQTLQLANNNFATSLYQIVDFSDTSSIYFKYGYNSDIPKKTAGYFPSNFLITTYLIGSVHNKKKRNINLYPNPSKGFVTLRSDKNLTGDYTLTNIEGRVVQRSGIIKNQFTVNKSLPNGVYFFELSTESDNLRYSGKIILVR